MQFSVRFGLELKLVKNKLILIVISFQVKFKASDVHVPDSPGMFTTFKAKNVPLFVDGQQFEMPIHYGKIMGYDKPINLRWEGDHTQSEAEARRKRKG